MIDDRAPRVTLFAGHAGQLPLGRAWCRLLGFQPGEAVGCQRSTSTNVDGPRGPGEVRIIGADPDRPNTGRILTWDPPRVFEHEWRFMREEAVIRWELAPDGDATILRMTHCGFTPRNAGGFAPGWHAYLDRLTAHVDGDPLPDWQERYQQVQPAYR